MTTHHGITDLYNGLIILRALPLGLELCCLLRVLAIKHYYYHLACCLGLDKGNVRKILLVARVRSLVGLNHKKIDFFITSVELST